MQTALPTVVPRPGKRMLALIQAVGSVNGAALMLRVDPMALSRWLKGKGSLSHRNVAQIIAVTRMPYEKLFEHEEEEP